MSSIRSRICLVQSSTEVRRFLKQYVLVWRRFHIYHNPSFCRNVHSSWGGHQGRQTQLIRSTQVQIRSGLVRGIYGGGKEARTIGVFKYVADINHSQWSVLHISFLQNLGHRSSLWASKASVANYFTYLCYKTRPNGLDGSASWSLILIQRS